MNNAGVESDGCIIGVSEEFRLRRARQSLLRYSAPTKQPVTFCCLASHSESKSITQEINGLIQYRQSIGGVLRGGRGSHSSDEATGYFPRARQSLLAADVTPPSGAAAGPNVGVQLGVG